MYLKKLCFASLLSLGLLHAQSSVGLNINDEDLEVRASIDLNALTYYSDSTSYTLDGSYLHTDGDNLTTFGVSAQNRFQGVEGLTLGLGIKSVFTDDFAALPFCAKAKYTLPFYSIPATSLATSLAYAPAVLTFRDGESYTEFRVEADMEVITNVHLFAGYRNIDTEYETYDRTFNNSFYGGMKLSF
ncbi:MAG TPA: YfaZ family outer membrane protein [Sulfurovum sp.]|uniref:YfaZ family outer membrane protein n=1 Tax=Sulfurovum sp. TaxID=1969726 RepID=UPI002F94BAC3